VQRAGDELLARARLAAHQHRDVPARGALEHVKHRFIAGSPVHIP
jgi:hypothetical protein